MTSELGLEENETWRTWLGESDSSYELAYRYGDIVGTIDRINAEKEKEKLEKKIAEKDEEIEKKKKKIEEILKSPSVPLTPANFSDEREEIEAQKWLEDNYGKDKEGVDEIVVNNKAGVKLIGKMKIMGYQNLDFISIEETGITELSIVDCPNVETIKVPGNEITKIVGLEDLSNLKKLDCAQNQISKLDISENPKLRTLIVLENQPDIEIIGLKKLSNLVRFGGDGSAPLNLLKVTKEELEEAASRLGFKKLESKSPEEIKEMIEKEGKKIRKNKDKIDSGLPGLLNQENEVDDNKLAEINKKIVKVEELEEEIDKMQIEMGKAAQRAKEFETKIIATRERLAETETILRREVGRDEWEDIKKRMDKKLEKEAKKREEKLESKVEVNDNK